MSHVSADCSRSVGRVRTEPPNQPAANRLTRPGWTEIAALVSFAVMFAAVAGGLLSLTQLEPVMYGLLLR